MTDIYACLCGNKVSQTDIKGSKAARCTYPGCETQWVSDCATIYSVFRLIGCGCSSIWTVSTLTLCLATGSVRCMQTPRRLGSRGIAFWVHYIIKYAHIRKEGGGGLR